MNHVRRRLLAGVLAGLVAGLVPVFAQSPSGGTLAVAAASDLQSVFPEIVSRFEKATGSKVNVSFGSSGNFFAQIQNGAPFDVYFSADVDYPLQLIASKQADTGSFYQYATGRIVLWTRKNSGIDVKAGLQTLRDAKVRRIAIANPQHAPYGKAAVAAMQSANVYDAAKPKLVFGENISQTAQLVDSGNAEAGIIALALALGPSLSASGTFAEIPASAHPPIEQAAVVVSASRQKALGQRFIDFLKTPDSLQLLRRFGFTPGPAAR